MRRPILALLVTMAPVQAQQPVVHFEETRLDLGRITQGRTVQATFHMRNIGSAPLRVSAITPSCGCTALDTEAFTLCPGEGRDLRTLLDTRELKGRFRKSITVDSNDLQLPSAELLLEGEAVPDPAPASPPQAQGRTSGRR